MIILLEPSFPKFNYAEISVLTENFSLIESFFTPNPPFSAKREGGTLVKRLLKRENYCLKRVVI